MISRRFGVVIWTAVMFVAPAAGAQSDGNLQRRVSINVSAVPPSQVLDMIARAVDCSAKVDPKVAEPVTIRVSRVTARTALNAVCESVGCRWRLEGKTLRVDAEPPDSPRGEPTAGEETKPRLSDPLPTGEPVYVMGDGVTPPAVVKEVRPQYTASAMKAKLQGQVDVEFVVLRDGSVSQARVIRSLSPELDEQALKAVREWSFTPGQLNGRPVAVRCTAQLTFTMPPPRRSPSWIPTAPWRNAPGIPPEEADGTGGEEPAVGRPPGQAPAVGRASRSNRTHGEGKSLVDRREQRSPGPCDQLRSAQ